MNNFGSDLYYFHQKQERNNQRHFNQQKSVNGARRNTNLTAYILQFKKQRTRIQKRL